MSLERTACSDAMDTSDNLFSEVWNQEDSLEWIRKALTSIGASIILAEDDDYRCLIAAHSDGFVQSTFSLHDV